MNCRNERFTFAILPFPVAGNAGDAARYHSYTPAAAKTSLPGTR